MSRIAEADGIQETAEKSTTIHHSANVLFNIMRGGIFANGGKIDVEDFVNSTVPVYTPTEFLQIPYWLDESDNMVLRVVLAWNGGLNCASTEHK